MSKRIDEQILLRVQPILAKNKTLQDITNIEIQIKLLDKNKKSLTSKPFSDKIPKAERTSTISNIFKKYNSKYKGKYIIKYETSAKEIAEKLNIKESDENYKKISFLSFWIDADCNHKFTNEFEKWFDVEIENSCLNTWDKHTNRRIKTLHPKIRCKVKDFINQVQSELNIKLRVTTALRTISEQNNLYTQGRTKPGKKVTWVKGGYSFHNYGLAIDIIKIEKDGTVDWGNIQYFSKVAKVAKKLGFEWGGDWKSTPDMPHFQYTFGYTTSQLKRKFENGDLENDYVKI